MPKTNNFPDPNGATTVGASVRIARLVAGASGVEIIYNPNNGDRPMETTILVLSAGARTNLASIIAELDAAYKTANGYT